MDREAIEAYFTAEQRKVLVIKMLDPCHFQIIQPTVAVDQSLERGAFILSAHGWSVQAIARAYKMSWNTAQKIMKRGYEQIEHEIEAKIEKIRNSEG